MDTFALAIAGPRPTPATLSALAASGPDPAKMTFASVSRSPTIASSFGASPGASISASSLSGGVLIAGTTAPVALASPGRGVAFGAADVRPAKAAASLTSDGASPVQMATPGRTGRFVDTPSTASRSSERSCCCKPCCPPGGDAPPTYTPSVNDPRYQLPNVQTGSGRSGVSTPNSNYQDIAGSLPGNWFPPPVNTG